MRRATVAAINSDHGDVIEVTIDIAGSSHPAMAYPALTGAIQVGDRVLVNTTAVELGLGTGGYHFIADNLDRPEVIRGNGGHIMKLRYTPYQIAVQAAEEQGSPHHRDVADFTDLGGTAVICSTLHSMLAPIVAGVDSAGQSKLRVAYVMTDGGALPIWMSETVRSLRRLGLIAQTVTSGHAFGGDYEAVSIYSALAIAADVVKADVIVVSMGPGKIGTATKYGCTELEQASVVDSVSALKGSAIAVPRVNMADPSYRHYGISPHTITVLQELTHTEAMVPLPHLGELEEMDEVGEAIRRARPLLEPQLAALQSTARHRFHTVRSRGAIEHLRSLDLPLNTMGRGFSQDPLFFAHAAAGGVAAAELAAER